VQPAPATPNLFRQFQLDVTWITEAVAACWYESLNRSHPLSVRVVGQGCPSSLRWTPLPLVILLGWSLPMDLVSLTVLIALVAIVIVLITIEIAHE
jgi:hypothetical protein